MEETKKETKAEKFKRVAEARTNKIIDQIKLLGNCSSTITYSYTDDQVKQIFDAIETELREAKRKFNKTDKDKNSRFSLK